MRFLSSALVSFVIVLGFASPALAGNWGEDWGTMAWGSVAAVPTMGWVGGALLGGLLVCLGQRRIRRASTGLGILLAFAYAPVADAQTVSVPNTFTNGSVAEAEQMNANFTAVENGVNAALTTGSVSVPNTFTNGTTADADQVNANFTAVVNGVNNALANRAADCAGAGGTWNAGTSTCTAALNYNCFIGGFCAQAAIEFPPAENAYVNVYDGDTQTTEPALGAGCNAEPGKSEWDTGSTVVPVSFVGCLSPIYALFVSSICH